VLVKDADVHVSRHLSQRTILGKTLVMNERIAQQERTWFDEKNNLGLPVFVRRHFLEATRSAVVRE
jgi:hypothetical protein